MVDAGAIRKLSDRELNDAAYRRRLVDEIARQGGDLEDEILAALAQRLIAASLFDEAEGIIASEAIAPLDKIDLLIVLADALQAGGEAARAARGRAAGGGRAAAGGGGGRRAPTAWLP